MFHIMVAEDDTNTRKLMCTVLKQNGYEPVPAVDGIDALDILDRQHVDLILLDVMMPRMDGYEFVKTLREGGCNTPVLMVTARETSADKIAGFRAGTDDYMVKPVDDEEMLLRIPHSCAAVILPTSISSTQAIPCLTMMRLQLPAAASRTSFPTRNLCCCSNCSAIRTKYSHAVSLWTSCGIWKPKPMKERLTYISTVCVSVSVTTRISR